MKPYLSKLLPFCDIFVLVYSDDIFYIYINRQWVMAIDKFRKKDIFLAKSIYYGILTHKTLYNDIH